MGRENTEYVSYNPVLTFGRELSSIVDFRGVGDHSVWENRIHATQDPIHIWTGISDQRKDEKASKHSGLKIQYRGSQESNRVHGRFHALVEVTQFYSSRKKGTN